MSKEVTTNQPEKKEYKLSEQDISLMNKRNELRNVFKELFANNSELNSVSWAQHKKDDKFLIDEFSVVFNTPLLTKTAHVCRDLHPFADSDKKDFILTDLQNKAYDEMLSICNTFNNDVERMRSNFGESERITVSMKGFSFSRYK